LPYSNCVHYDAEPARRAEYHSLVNDGMLPGFAVDDGVALHFHETSLARVVSSRRGGRASHVKRVGDEVAEIALNVTYLGESAVKAMPHERAVVMA
jgi:peptidase E